MLGGPVRWECSLGQAWVRPCLLKCKNQYLVLALVEETAVQALFGSIVWAFRRLKKSRSRDMSARNYAFHSVCPQLSFLSCTQCYHNMTARTTLAVIKTSSMIDCRRLKTWSIQTTDTWIQGRWLKPSGSCQCSARVVLLVTDGIQWTVTKPGIHHHTTNVYKT